MKTERITWIDGLRGLACLFIFFHHFIMGFYPAAFQQEGNLCHFQGNVEAAFSQSPLSYFVIGDLWVSVFCLVSGFVIAWQVFHMSEEKQFSVAVLKRYPRLMLPLFALSAIVFVMLQLQLFYNGPASVLTGSSWFASFYQSKTSLSDLFFASVVDTWIVGLTNTYSNAFWMLSDLFAGSFMAYILAAMGRKMNRGMLFVYLGVAIVYLSTNSRLTNFAIGVLLAYTAIQYGEKIREKKKLCTVLGILFLAVSVLLGGYPTSVTPTNFYRYFAKIIGRINPIQFYHMLSAACLLTGIYLLKPLGRFLSLKPFLWLGKISYSVFLVHIPILFSVGAWVMVRVMSMTGRYHVSAMTAFGVCLILVLFIGWGFYQWIERPCSKFTNWIVLKLTVTGRK